MMSWSEAKIHKQPAPDLLQSLLFAEQDLSAATAESDRGASDDFQVVPLCRPRTAPAASPASPALEPPPKAAAGSGSAGPGPDQQLEKELNDLLGALASSLKELDRLRTKVLKNSTEDMLRLVFAIAEQVIHCEVKADPRVILTTVEKALQTAMNSDEYHIKVHPDDLAMVMEKKPLFLASVSGLKNITLEADGKVTRGGCLIESELGQIDATIEGQLEELRQQLPAAVANE